MKINKKILSIPPYISTSWDHVLALKMKNSDLVVCLTDGHTIDIPGLKPEIVEAIFFCHASYLESQEKRQQQQSRSNHPFNFLETENEAASPFRFGFGTFDALGSSLQHNPSQANGPDLPQEVLSKITAIAKIVAPDSAVDIPKPEPKCNCIHCQIARAIQIGINGPEAQSEEGEMEEEIKPEDLHFQQWEIEQSGDKLYTVINRLDAKERYSVFLGHPVGCTCGKQGCEHILAVLKS